MKLIFNDATDMPIQSYEKIGGAVRFLTIGIAPEKLKEIFEDATKNKGDERHRTWADHRYLGKLHGIRLY